MTDETRRTPKELLEEQIWRLFTQGAYETCIAIGNAAIPTLLNKLKSQHAASADNTPQIRENLILILGQIVYNETKQRKLAWIQRHAGPLNPDMEQLLRTRKDVADQIAVCLADKEASVRVAAINALLKIAEPNVGAQILPMLDDESAEVQVTTIKALEEIGYRGAIPGLMSKLGNRSLHVADEFLGQLPAARVCDQALRVLLNFDEKTGWAALQHAFIGGDKLLKAHAVEGLKEIRGRIKDGWVQTPLASAYRDLLYRRTHIPDPDDEKKISWDEALDLIDEKGIVEILGELALDTSPVVEETLSTTLFENLEVFLANLRAEDLDDEGKAWVQETPQTLKYLWGRPVGYQGIQGLYTIRTSKAIRLLLPALESSNPDIRTFAAEALGNWLMNFPDSGWTIADGDAVLMSPEIEQLREVAVNKLVDLLQDETVVDTGYVMVKISYIVAESLNLSGTDTAKSALEAWKGSEGRELLPPV